MPFNSDRRRFVSNLAGGLLTWAIFQPAARAAPSAEPRVNASRLQGTLEELSTFGRPVGGSFADGVSRVAYSDADVAGRAYVIGLMASKLVEAVREITTRTPGRQVGTVGRFQVFPNAPNVVPGLVKLSVEFRDLSADTVARLGNEVTARAKEVAEQTGTEISLERIARDPAALADPKMQAQIEAAAASLDLKTMHLPSGAGHDAQFLAKLGPMAMIFVPSLGGISHAPKELSRWSDCANGADVLLRTVLRVDRAKL